MPANCHWLDSPWLGWVGLQTLVPFSTKTVSFPLVVYIFFRLPCMYSFFFSVPADTVSTNRDRRKAKKQCNPQWEKTLSAASFFLFLGCTIPCSCSQ